jgi:CheY-like chemotaxis protein
MARILIIDKEEGPARDLARTLKKQGYTVDTVPDSATTFSYLRKDTPNLIVLDLMAAIKGKPAELPEGVRLLAQLYLDLPEIPLVVYSRSRKYKNQFWSWAAAAHLNKKDGPEPVVEVIQRLLSAWKG